MPLADLLHIVEEYAIFRTAATAAAKRSYDRLVWQVAAKVIRPKFRMLLARKRRGRAVAACRSGDVCRVPTIDI